MVLDWKNDRFLILSIGVSVLVHIVLLSIKFIPTPQPFTSPPSNMMAIIVNLKTTTPPKNAKHMAQVNQDAGGQLEEKSRLATSPLPKSDQARSEQVAIKDSVAEAQKRVEALEKEVQRMSLLAKQGNWNRAPTTPSEQSAASNDKNQQLALDLAAKIDKQISDYASRPKKVFVGASAIQSDFAVWVDGWQRKVEDIGNQFYPEQAKGKTRGTLILTVGITKTGQIESIKVDKSSGYEVLDTAAKRILQLSAPFTVFSPEMQKKADVLYITRQWRFGPSGLSSIETI